MANIIENEIWYLENVLEKIHFPEKKSKSENSDKDNQNQANGDGNDIKVDVIDSPSFKISRKKTDSLRKSKNKKISNFFLQNKNISAPQFIELLNNNKEKKRRRLYSDEPRDDKNDNKGGDSPTKIKPRSRQFSAKPKRIQNSRETSLPNAKKTIFSRNITPLGSRSNSNFFEAPNSDKK